MKNCLSLIAVCLLSTLYFPYSTTAQCTWNSPTGNWSDGTKWSCGHAPLAAENAVINAGTITLDVAPMITNLTMNGGTITGTNNLTVNGNMIMTNLPVLGNTGDVTVAGTFAWSGGTIGSTDGTATGVVNITGLTTMTSSSQKTLRKKTLNLYNGADYSGNGTITFSHSSVLNIPAMQSFNANTSLSVTWFSNAPGGTINNAGTFDKQGSGSLTCQAVFNNTGTTQVTGGSLNLSGGGTHNGAFSTAASTTLEFGGGTNNLSTSTISGTGLLEISAGTVTLPNNSSHGDVLASGGTSNFSGANTMQNLTVGSGSVNLLGTLSVQDLTFSNSGSISGACPITVSGNLNMSVGNLGNTGDVTVAGAFAWSGGTIGSTDGTATGTVNITGLTTMTSSSQKTLRKKTLNLNNGVNYSGNGAITFSHSSVLNIPAMQSFNTNVTANVTWFINAPGGTINNAGTFDKQGSGSLTCQAVFSNTGTTQVTGGSLNLTGGGTHNGAFSIAPATTLEFGGGTNDLSTSTISGTGLLEVSAGTVTLPNNSIHGDVLASGGTSNFSGANTMQNLTVGSGTVNLSGSLSVQNLTFSNSGSISGACPVTVNGSLDMSGGALGNTGDVTVAGTFAWTSGTIGSNDGSATGTVYITGLTTITTAASKSLRKKTLNLNNGADYSGNGSINFYYGCVLNIPAMKSFNANMTLSGTWFSNTGGGMLNNAGTFDKQGSGSLTCQIVFSNTGTTQVTGGLLNLTGGGTHNGAFSISPATTLEFSGGNNNLSTSTISGTGTLAVSAGLVTLPNNSTHSDVLANGGTANFSGANTMQNLTVGSGTVNLLGTLSVQDLTFSNSGSISGACPITVSGNLDMNGGALGNTGDVTVAGTFAWAAGTIGSNDGSATGTVYITGLTTITTAASKSLRKKTLNLNNGANYSSNGSFQYTHGSVLNIPATKSFNVNVTSNVTWLISAPGGTINNAGTFDKQGSGSLTCQANFDNSGTITGTSTITFTGTFTNTGLISPGASPGILNLNKTAPGITVQNLAIELEGPSPGTGGYDQLNNTTGALNLNGGTLTVTLLNGYLPNVGTTFTIATGTSRTGTFGTLNLPVDNARWTVTYNATNVVLTVALNLPVELLDFQAKRMGPQVRLNWATATEHDNRGFGIERSSDGRDFENIAFMEGKGDSDVRVDYTFDDPTPPAARVIYYRLRQEDISGKMEYSPVRSVEGVRSNDRSHLAQSRCRSGSPVPRPACRILRNRRGDGYAGAGDATLVFIGFAQR